MLQHRYTPAQHDVEEFNRWLMGNTSLAGHEDGGEGKERDLEGPEASEDSEEGGLAAAVGAHDHD